MKSKPSAMHSAAVAMSQSMQMDICQTEETISSCLHKCAARNTSNMFALCTVGLKHSRPLFSRVDTNKDVAFQDHEVYFTEHSARTFLFLRFSRAGCLWCGFQQYRSTTSVHLDIIRYLCVFGLVCCCFRDIFQCILTDRTFLKWKC